MTVKELYRALSERIPSELSCSWDNDGLMCCPSGERQVRRVLIALDVTEAAVARAAEGGFDLIVSHHPFIFKGLKAVSEDNYIASKAICLIKNDISVMSFHTRLDAVQGGVNDTLAKLLGLVDVSSFGEEGIGRIGELEAALGAEELAGRVKEALGVPFVLLSDCGRLIRRVAVLGGEGGDDIALAKAAGADAYVSGRLGYHSMVDASEADMTLIEAGHFYTEYPVCQVISEMLRELDGDIYTEVYFSNKIRVI